MSLQGRLRRDQLTTTVTACSTGRLTLVSFGTSVLRCHLFFMTLRTLNPICSDLLGANHLLH